MGEELWGVVLIVGPLLLLGAAIFVFLSNRKATPRGPAGQRDTGMVGTTNAVQGSDKARPDLARDEARAKSGESVESRADDAGGSAHDGGGSGGGGADGGGGGGD